MISIAHAAHDKSHRSLRGSGRTMLKRTFDLLAAAAGLVVLCPFVVLAMLVIRLTSPGSSIFTQTRIGRSGLPFECYKLRTMWTGTADLPSHEVGDGALTSIGAFLRRTKFDEIPQLYNVVRGEMSLVGPRPCLPMQTELIQARKNHGALDVRPGVTGLAQVQGVDMSDPERLAAIDGQYVRSQSFMGDLSLILQTVIGAGRGTDAVRSRRSP